MIETIPAGAPVFLFSGQGSQKPGMGADLMDVPEVRATFACASEVLGFDVADLVLNADAAELNDTRNAQPALCVLSVAVARALMARCAACGGAGLLARPGERARRVGHADR